jgi:hypothetical protein
LSILFEEREEVFPGCQSLTGHVPPKNTDHTAPTLREIVSGTQDRQSLSIVLILHLFIHHGRNCSNSEITVVMIDESHLLERQESDLSAHCSYFRGLLYYEKFARRLSNKTFLV